MKRIEVIAAVGTELGIVENDEEVLSIIVRPPGCEWPHGMTPEMGLNTILEGNTRYAVIDDLEDGRVQNEIASVLLLMDNQANIWGDEGVFRRCRDRLRALLPRCP